MQINAWFKEKLPCAAPVARVTIVLTLMNICLWSICGCDMEMLCYVMHIWVRDIWGGNRWTSVAYVDLSRPAYNKSWMGETSDNKCQNRNPVCVVWVDSVCTTFCRSVHPVSGGAERYMTPHTNRLRNIILSMVVKSGATRICVATTLGLHFENKPYIGLWAGYLGTWWKHFVELCDVSSTTLFSMCDFHNRKICISKWTPASVYVRVIVNCWDVYRM